MLKPPSGLVRPMMSVPTPARFLTVERVVILETTPIFAVGFGVGCMFTSTAVCPAAMICAPPMPWPTPLSNDQRSAASARQEGM